MPRNDPARQLKWRRDGEVPEKTRAGDGELPFWKRKSLEEMTQDEWESLCDGCGRCCLVKLEDEDSGKVYFTDIGGKLFDPASCPCADLAPRPRKVRDCIQVTPAKVRALGCLPPTCAYRLSAEGRDLAWWHPLVSGSDL